MPEKKRAKKGEQKEEKQASSGQPEFESFRGRRSIFKNARVVWDDRKEDVRQAVDDCDIVVEGFSPGSPFDFNVPCCSFPPPSLR